jgi:phosphotransferase system HPr (HPr) family protein
VPEIKLTVHHKDGLHARPAAQFVNTAKRFQCDITVARCGTEANAKSIVRVLALGVNQGSEVTIRAEGEGADQALAALEALIQKGFDHTL